MASVKRGSMEDFIAFLEALESKLEDKKEPVKDNFDELPHALAFGISDLVDTKVEEFHDCKVITRTFETEDTTVTIKTRVAKEELPTEKEMWDESIDSILDDLDQEIAWAESNSKMELLKLLNRKRNFIASKR
jgi:hypothetical protein